MNSCFKRILAGVLAACMLSGFAVAAPEAAEETAPRRLQELPAPRVSSRASNEAAAAAARAAASSARPAKDVSLPADTDAAAKKTVTALPDADFADGRLLVKVRQQAMLMGGETVFDRISESVTPLFTLPEPTGEVVLADAEEPCSSWLQVELADGVDMLEAWNLLLNEESVLCVEPDYVRTGAASPHEVTGNDPFRFSQAWLDQINAYEAWERVPSPGARNGEPVIVAVIDSGVDLDHPDLTNQLVPGYDFAEMDDAPYDTDGHGTHVAGIIAAEKNTIGGRGVAYDARVMPVRVLGADGSGYTSVIADSIAWSAGATGVFEGVSDVAQPADIINLSLGGTGNSMIEQDAINFARSQGVLVVAAAGNESLPTAYAGDSYYGAYTSPSDIPGVLTVMAMNSAPQANGDWLASFSNYDSDPLAGLENEIMAPGTSIYSTYTNQDYAYLQGTSMACPVVSGAAAVLMGLGCTAEEAWELLVFESPVKQGKTQPDGTVRHFPALDLEAAVNAKLNGTARQTAPFVGNAEVTASLPANLDFGHGSVNFRTLNTESWVYYYKNAFQSVLTLNFENFGGSGRLDITGTVGGRPVSASVNTVAGDVAALELNFSGTPATNSDGCVEIVLYANGVEILEQELFALDIKTPDMSGQFYVDVSLAYEDAPLGFYRPSTRTLTLSGSSSRGTLWVLDIPLWLPTGHSLLIEPEDTHNLVVVYQDSDAWLETSYISSTDAISEIEIVASALLGCGGFYVFGLGNTYLYGCQLFDPYIEWAQQVNQCMILDGGAHFDKLLQGWYFDVNGFVDCPYLTIDCGYFCNNLVNRCAYGTLKVTGEALGNTFIENYVPYDANSVLYAHVPTAQEGQGLWYSSVIGPMTICGMNGMTPVYTLAKVQKVYYQKADDPELTFADKLKCSSQSVTTSSLSTMNSWGYVWDTPVFITNVETDYDYVSATGSADCVIDCTFSTAVAEDSQPYVTSNHNDMVSNAVVELYPDRTGCRIYVTSMVTEMDEIYDYRLGGIITPDYVDAANGIYHYFWATELSEQTMHLSLDLYSTRLASTSAQLLSPGVIQVHWSDSRVKPEHTAVISRRVDNGDAEVLGSVNATTGVYTDNTATSGHIYEYTVSIYNNKGVKGYSGTAICVYVKDNLHGHTPIELSSDGNTLTFGLDSVWRIAGDAALSYTLPEEMARSVQFSPTLAAKKLTCGAVNNGDGTVTVTIGRPDSSESAAMMAGEELFTVVASAGAVCTAAGSDALCQTADKLHIWRQDNNPVIYAGYRNGRLCGTVVLDGQQQINTRPLPENADLWKAYQVDTGWVPLHLPVEFTF